jgi:hypothetical protein
MNNSSGTESAVSQITRYLFQGMMSKRYDMVADFIEFCALKENDAPSLADLNAIRDSGTLPFEQYCQLYALSFNIPPRRGLRFMGRQRMGVAQFQAMFNYEIAQPMRALVISMLAKMNKSQLAELSDWARNISETAPGAAKMSMDRVVLD